ncbi:MAG TPA: cytochrome B, partial [Erythrobacter sp.]|nr:cytochrome B [Erythrobacter sp.]
MSDTNARRYSTGAMVFHWVIAVLVIANWQIAERAEALDMP